MKDETPAFDFDAPASSDADGSSWHEVPHERFLSWSPVMQAAYCRDRDLDASEHAESEWWQQFYLRRANAYEEMAKA